MSRVYVGNLPFTTTEEELSALFQPFGQITFLSIPTGRQSRSRGYGVVEYAHDHEAQVAIQQLNGQPIGDRPMTVREDKPAGAMTNGKPAGGPVAAAGGPLADVPVNEGCRLFLGNLSWQTTSADLMSHCQQAAHVINGEVAQASSGKSKGWGLVDVASPQDAQNAIQQLHNTDLHGRSIIVRLERPAGSGPAKVKAPSNAPPRTGTSSGRQIVVRNLPWSTKSEDLREVFQQVGEVITAEAICHEDTGRSKGWGTVLFAKEEEAATAISGFNNVKYQGRPMQVKLDRYA